MPSRRRPAAIALVALMVVGSLALWIAIPLGWIWLGSMLADSQEPEMGPYLMIIVGIPVSMFLMGRLLGRLNRMYGEVTGTTPTVRFRYPWHRSLRGERESAAPRTILDVVMVISVLAAGFVFLVWFLFFAGSSLPGG